VDEQTQLVATGEASKSLSRRAYLQISFSPSVSDISHARKFVTAIYGPLLDDPDAADRLAIAAHELLENAFKYSPDGELTLRVEIARVEGGREVFVETRNRIDAEARSTLDQVFRSMSEAKDAMAHYEATLKSASKRSQGSGLGLARIWAESEMPLSHSYDGDVVFVRAVAIVPEAST
jgi:two-component sensor histidine kinase